MRFRKTVVLPKEQGLGHIGAGGSISIDLGGPHAISVEVREAPHEEKELLAVLNATSQFDPSARVVALLDAFRTAERPLIYDELEQPLKSLAETVQDELFSATVRVFGLLRWRNANPGSHRRFIDRGTTWSLNGDDWYAMPVRVIPHGRVSRGLILTEESRRNVAELVAEGRAEPLAHELLREAQSAARDPRTALISSVAALEIGIKACVASLLPLAQWLVENVPSPPVERLLNEYLPTLPAKLTINGKILPPPPTHMATIKKAIGLRNKVVHSGKADVSWQTSNEVLRVVGDVLWLLDYYAGHAWALNHVTRQMADQLNGVPPPPR